MWEYEMVKLPPKTEPRVELAALDEMGREGWELATTVVDNGTTYHYMMRKFVPPYCTEQTQMEKEPT